MDQYPSSSVDVIDAFRALTAEARRNVCRTLVAEFSHAECHEVWDLIFNRFHFDVLENLPLELSARVAGYLEPSETFRLRQVSRRWNELFSTPAICGSSFRSFNSHQILNTSAAEWKQSYSRYAKCQLALRTGRPAGEALYSDISSDWSQCNDNTISYSDGMIAWAKNQVILLLCLRSGRARYFNTANRQVVVCVRVSSRIIAALTSHGSCQVWNHKSGKEGMLRLPSANYKVSLGYIRHNFLVDEDTIAVYLAGSQSIIVWDLRTETSRQIYIGAEPFHIFLDAKGKTLTVMRLEDAHENLVYRHGDHISQIVGVTYSIDRNSRSDQRSFSFPLPNSVMSVDLRLHSCLNNIKSCCFRLSTTISHDKKDDAQPLAVGEFITFISYSNILNRPVARFYPEIPCGEMDKRCLATVMSEGLVYYLAENDTDSSAIVLDYRRGEAIQAPGINLASGVFGGNSQYPCYCFGDTFIYGIGLSDVVRVWCFDEDVMAGGGIGRHEIFRDRRDLES
ncbi:hypothetical protein DIZ76_014159 [Coccidioides immitis]|nr:hypothetical protein DIZ76_014159 [Coccidioides immitis]